MSKEDIWDRSMDQTHVGATKGVVQARTIKRFRKENDGLTACGTKHSAANCHQMHWKMTAVELESERPGESKRRKEHPEEAQQQ